MHVLKTPLVTQLRKYLLLLPYATSLDAIPPGLIIGVGLLLNNPFLLLRFDYCPTEFTEVVRLDLARCFRVVAKKLTSQRNILTSDALP